MTVAYETAYQWVVVLGGLASLSSLAAGLCYRLGTSGGSKLAVLGGASLGSLVVIYALGLLPWGGVLWCARGQETGLAGIAGVWTGAAIRQQALLSVLMLSAVGAQVWLGQRPLATRWAAESLGCGLCLQLCWILIQLCQSLLSALLWLEIAGLGAMLFISFVALNKAERAPIFVGWRAFYVSRQTQYGLLTALLAFIWASGMAIILLLFGLSFGLSLGYTLELPLLMLSRGALETSSAGAGVGLFWSLVAGGLLIKLMLQPFQAFLLAFYRRLPLQAMVAYLVVYYVFLLPALVFTFCGALAAVASGWSLVVLSLCGVVGFSAVVGLGAAVDLRHTLALSTVVNVSLLLLAGVYFVQ